MPAAARLYFDKQVSELSLQEAALLAGLIRAPSQLSPLRDLDAAHARAAVVLDAMAANGVLDSEMAEQAKADPASLNRAESSTSTEAGAWFGDWIAEEAAELSASFRGNMSNMRVRTTLIPALQSLAEEIVAEALASQTPGSGPSQAALVAMRPDGAVVAMVGGRDYNQSKFNRAVQAMRQPGSAFKLFVYLAALRNGYSLSDTIEDAPLQVGRWRPANFGGRHYGRVTLSEAFARSLNTAAARLALDVGLDEVIAAARDLGIDAPLAPNPSLALGTSEVSLLDLTGAFASVRAGMMPIQPWGIAAFGAEAGSQLYSMGPPVIARRSLGAHHKELLSLLRLVVERGTGRAAALDGFAAGKTGTSQNFRDAWFIGFNESLVTGVWVGNDDNSPMARVTGGTLPARIWRRFMTRAPDVIEKERQTAPPRIQRPSDGMARIDPRWGPIRPPPMARSGAFFGAPERPRCDIEACASRYRSFRASDCTYQPYRGPRRYCDIGAGQPESRRLFSEAPRRRQCDYAACASAYRSFRPSDCTFQPYRGPRRLCER